MRKSAGAGVSLTGRGLQDLSETRPDLARSRAPVCDDDLLVRESLITSPLGPTTYFFEQRQRSDQMDPAAVSNATVKLVGQRLRQSSRLSPRHAQSDRDAARSGALAAIGGWWVDAIE
jgi:hypothetical protein